ncbi:N-alpha-acetyltransferase 35, NatC auxiliary subunit like [Actinidia chinensis var. chinensis]|uniref:N-alpha-acetyltransferase 35, NatC auxiliary subunit like n=1 Tax=Actinidia chinensis var. chinensis TaxID=1590841 RepID=A0A2R6S1G3_ACTCC|nr:N-alpha-acetyltransferase 35, NatC auxiliary subunit like [Actinidia chinensis var. chinensis]
MMGNRDISTRSSRPNPLTILIDRGDLARTPAKLHGLEYKYRWCRIFQIFVYFLDFPLYDKHAGGNGGVEGQTREREERAALFALLAINISFFSLLAKLSHFHTTQSSMTKLLLNAYHKEHTGNPLCKSVHMYFEREREREKEMGTLLTGHSKLCAKISKHILIWVKDQTYWIASRFLILGFELELYSPNASSSIITFDHPLRLTAPKAYMKLKILVLCKQKGRKKKDSLKELARDYQIPPTVLLLQCQIYLAEGLAMLFQMLASLRSEHKVFPSLGPFNMEHERFIQHFKLLQKASIPDQISYLSYKESTTQARSSNLEMHNCFKDAQRIAKELRSSVSNDQERMAELRRIEQVAEHNGVAINLVCRLRTLDPSLTGCLASGDGPGFGHLSDLVSLLSPSPGFGLQFCVPDFFADGFQIHPQPDISRTGVTPVRGHAEHRVVVKDDCALVFGWMKRGQESCEQSEEQSTIFFKEIFRRMKPYQRAAEVGGHHVEHRPASSFIKEREREALSKSKSLAERIKKEKAGGNFQEVSQMG